MPDFIYSESIEKNEPMYGKFLLPIKALIEEESNISKRAKTTISALFNVETSNQFAETVMGESGFGTFMAKDEGAGAESDSVEKTYHKTISHLEFAKKFIITRPMADDSRIGIAASIKAKARNFTSAYYRTRLEACASLLAGATEETVDFAGKTLDATVGDEMPAFSNAHTYATEALEGETQSNYYYGDISDAVKLEDILNQASNYLRNFKDENGKPMNYVADTLIIPCNRPRFEALVKKVIGSERTVGTANNDINIQYGNWTLVVLDGWEATADEFIIMSSDANEQLLGNMFYDRKKLDIINYVDKDTRNYIWNGYCRFGVGFGTWKHMLRVVHSTVAVDNADLIGDPAPVVTGGSK